jgi:hypothetical protein
MWLTLSLDNSTKPWCHYFLFGFEDIQARDDHIARHQRPFRCGVDGCHGNQVGFSNDAELTKHNTRIHDPDTPADLFPSDVRRLDIFKAATQGKLGVIQGFVGCGTSVNARDGSERTDPVVLGYAWQTLSSVPMAP